MMWFLWRFGDSNHKMTSQKKIHQRNGSVKIRFTPCINITPTGHWEKYHPQIVLMWVQSFPSLGNSPICISKEVMYGSSPTGKIGEVVLVARNQQGLRGNLDLPLRHNKILLNWWTTVAWNFSHDWLPKKNLGRFGTIRIHPNPIMWNHVHGQRPGEQSLNRVKGSKSTSILNQIHLLHPDFTEINSIGWCAFLPNFLGWKSCLVHCFYQKCLTIWMIA